MNLVAILTPRFRVLDAEMRLREQFYAMSKADRDAYRLEQINARWSEAMTGSQYYRALPAKEKQPPQFESSEQFRKVMPITQKAQVQANLQALRLPGCRRGKWMVTGGSTGAPPALGGRGDCAGPRVLLRSEGAYAGRQLPRCGREHARECALMSRSRQVEPLRHLPTNGWPAMAVVSPAFLKTHTGSGGGGR